MRRIDAKPRAKPRGTGAYSGADFHLHLRALIAEDDPVDGELTLSSLRQAGYEIDAEIVSRMEQFRTALGWEAHPKEPDDVRVVCASHRPPVGRSP